MIAVFNSAATLFLFSFLISITYNSILDMANKTGENKSKIGPGDLMKVLTTLLGAENKPTKAEVNLFIWVYCCLKVF